MQTSAVSGLFTVLFLGFNMWFKLLRKLEFRSISHANFGVFFRYQEGTTLAVKAAVEALHGQFKVLTNRYGNGVMNFALPLTRQDLHIHLPGLRYKVGAIQLHTPAPSL